MDEIRHLRPVITYPLQGSYSYERHEGPEILCQRCVNDRHIEEWIEHSLQLVRPYTQGRLRSYMVWTYLVKITIKWNKQSRGVCDDVRQASAYEEKRPVE